ncbi:MAG: hypothetical protein ACO1OB_23510 [Archangium sp.]
MQFVHVISSFPTLPLTVLLGVAVGYWLFALVTGVAFDHLDGAADSAADAVTGALKGGAESIADTAADAVTGAVKGSAEAVDSNGAVDGGFLALFGLGRVPVTFTISLVLLVAWTISAITTSTFGPFGVALGVMLLVASLFIGLLGAAAILRPLGKALNQSKPARRRDSLGQICVITSGRVDGTFGTASVDDGGAGLNVHVVCHKPNELKKGDRAILIELDAQHGVYEVEPVDWLLPQEIEALKDPGLAAQVLSNRVRRR